MQQFDVVILGAGASGLFCAGLIAQSGLRVLVLEHNATVAKKIKISGGGRCNFTNKHSSPANFISEQPNFCKTALKAFTAKDFISWVRRQRIGFHEKHKGQLFCDLSSQQLIDALVRQAEQHSARLQLGTKVEKISYQPQADNAKPSYQLTTSAGNFQCANLIVACGGLSIPKIGASDLGYRIARQFDLAVTATSPALVPLTFDKDFWQPFSQLAGISLPVTISTSYQGRSISFDEDLLFTHRGLSGPAILQISSYYTPGNTININLLPQQSVKQLIAAAQATAGNKKLTNLLAGLLPSRLIQHWLQQNPAWQRFLAETSRVALQQFTDSLHNWQVIPNGSEGYKKAEVTRGGVACTELDNKTMQSKKQPGLYFIGEVVDVTGWLGGYNFQWAWSSAYLCAQNLVKNQQKD